MAKLSTIDMFLDPRIIKATSLEDLQNRFLEGEPIVDANNVTTWFLEQSSTTIANAMLSVKNEIEVLYKLRANTTEDLYKHLSDYDITGIYSTPATIDLVIEIEKTSIAYRSKDLSDTHKLIIIPKDTEFNIGDYNFGLYYPIHIRINKRTMAVSVNWDDTESNSLNILNNNTIDFVEIVEDGLTYIQMVIPVYQFKRISKEEIITRDMGLVKSYTYDDNFYAAKVYNLVNDKWKELKVTLSETNYDIYNPTVRLVVDQDTNSIKVVIPSIYVNANLIASKIKIDIYTTKGYLDVDIASIETDTVTKNFHVSNSDDYSIILDKEALIAIYPHTDVIVGGSDGINTKELKDRIVNNSFSGEVIKSTTDIEKYFENKGFTSTRFACNITDMVYLCHNQLTNSKGGIIAAGNVKTIFVPETPEICSTIKENIDGSLTVTPETIYKYNGVSNTCSPLSDDELLALNALNKENKIKEYNTNIYTKSPFYIRVERSSRYPMAYTYDLAQPTAKYLKTVVENFNVEVILKVYGIQIFHENGWYDIRCLIGKSDFLTPAEIDLFFYIKATNGARIWTTGTYVGEYQDKWVYNIRIETNYSIFKSGTMYSTNLRNNDGEVGYEIPMEFDGNIVLLVKNNYVHSSGYGGSVGNIVPTSLRVDKTPIIEQTAIITLGRYLSGLYNAVDVMYKAQEELLYDADVIATAPSKIIETKIETDVNGNSVVTYTTLYEAGDVLLNDKGEPIKLHVAGERVLDSNGLPIVLKAGERNLDYIVEMLHIDAKLDLVTNPSYDPIMSYLRKKIISYMSIVDDAYNHLIEGTKLFYSPVNTIGYTASAIGNNYSYNHSLELTVRFKLYVYDFVLKDDKIKSNIYDNIVEIIDTYTKNYENNVISLDSIVEIIKNNMKEHIINVNVYGFFDDISVQTLVRTSSDIKPHLKQFLVLEDDGTINIGRGLTLEFASL